MKNGKKIMMIGLVAILVMTTIVPVQAALIMKAPAEAIAIPLGTLSVSMKEKSVKGGTSFSAFVIKFGPFEKNKGGTTASDALVVIKNEKGAIIEKGITDKNGEVRFTAPKEVGTYILLATLEGYSPAMTYLYVN